MSFKHCRYLENVNTIDKPLAKLTKTLEKLINKIRVEKGVTATNKDSKCIVLRIQF